MSRAKRTVVAGLGLVGCFSFTSAQAVQETGPQKHDNAEARQLLGQAEQAAAKITDKNDKIKTLEAIAMARAHTGDYEGARLIARGLGTNESKARILREMAIEQALGGDSDTAVKTIGGIAAREDKIDAYCRIADRLVDAHNKIAALDVLSHMPDFRYTNDSKTMVIMLSLGHALAKAGFSEAASNVATDNPVKGPLWNDINTTILVTVNAFNHDMKGARAKYAFLHTPAFKMVALGTIGEAQRVFGDKKDSAATYRELVALCWTLPDRESLVLDVAQDQFDNGETADSQATVKALLDSLRDKVADDLLSQIGAQQAEDGDIEGAQKTLARIKEPGHQAVVWKGLAFIKAKAGDVTGALAVAPKDADPYGQAQVLLGTARGILKALKPDDKP